MQPRLIIEAVNPPVTVPLGATDRFIIGRSSTANLPINDPGVSRQHCALVITPDGVEIEDLHSRGGTFLNGELVVYKMQLRDGDEIRVGDTILRFSGAKTMAAGAVAQTNGKEMAISSRPESARCPSCGAGLPEGFVVCTNCGMNFKTGARVRNTITPAEPLADNGRRKKAIPWALILIIALIAGVIAGIKSGVEEWNRRSPPNEQITLPKVFSSVGTITFAEKVDPKTLKTTNEGTEFTTGWVAMVVRGTKSFGDTKLVTYVRPHGSEAWSPSREDTVGADWDLCATLVLLDQEGLYDIKITDSKGRKIAEGTVRIAGSPSGSSSYSGSEVKTEPTHSQAWLHGYERGKVYGKMDRDLAGYSNFEPDDGTKIMTVAPYRYGLGTTEYGDFWDGYKQGYLQAR